MPKRTRMPNPYGGTVSYAPLPVAERIKLAKLALTSQQPPNDLLLEGQMRELIENLCYLAWDREEEGVEVDSLLINMIEWYYRRKAEPDELSRAAGSPGGLRRVAVRNFCCAPQLVSG